MKLLGIIGTQEIFILVVTLILTIGVIWILYGCYKLIKFAISQGREGRLRNGSAPR